MNAPAALSTPRQQTDFRARFSTAEFADIFSAGRQCDIRLELIDGELARMTPPLGSHSSRQSSLFGQLWSAFGSRAMVEAPIAVSESTVLVCDVALLVAPMGEPRFVLAEEVLLVAEVAETTLDRDRGIKRICYAGASIPLYWVVDGKRRVVHVYTDPQNGDYAALRTLQFGEPMPVPGSDRTITLE